MPTIGTVGALIDMAAVCIDGKTGKNTIGDLQAKITGEKLTLAQRQSRAAQQLGRSLALGTMEEMVDYITELANGETPENVFAMWYADSSAE